MHIGVCSTRSTEPAWREYRLDHVRQEPENCGGQEDEARRVGRRTHGKVCAAAARLGGLTPQTGWVRGLRAQAGSVRHIVKFSNRVPSAVNA